MRILNACPVKVGDWIRYKESNVPPDWCRVIRVERRWDYWHVYVSEYPYVFWSCTLNDMCGIEVRKNNENS